MVNLDLAGFSSIQSVIEQNLSTKASLELHDHVRSFIDRALATVAKSGVGSIIANTGDGAIIGFDEPSIAYQFGAALHDLANDWNVLRSDLLAKRIFRIGIATGLVEVRRQPDELAVAGYVISRAVRLQACAAPGSILIDDTTYEKMDRHLRHAFRGPETVKGKRSEVFKAYRCVCHQIAAEELLSSEPTDQPVALPEQIEPSLLASMFYEKAVAKEQDCKLPPDGKAGMVKAALPFYQRSAELGHIYAVNRLGEIAAFGLDGQAPDLNAAFGYFHQAALNGHRRAQFHLGMCHLLARGTAADQSRARHWLERSAAQDCHEAKECLKKLQHVGSPPGQTGRQI